MCQFGDKSKILEELNIDQSEALVGWRDNYITDPFNNEEKFLKAVSNYYFYPKDKDAEGLGLERDNSLGIYNNNNNNYYNYYNNNYNYYNYNNYNNNYNNYNNYYNNDYNDYNNDYYYYYYYYIQVKTLHYGKVFKYEEGYRSEYCKITHLITLDKDSNWFTDDNTKKFATHFNNLLKSLAKEYNCKTLEWSKRS